MLGLVLEDDEETTTAPYTHAELMPKDRAPTLNWVLELEEMRRHVRAGVRSDIDQHLAAKDRFEPRVTDAAARASVCFALLTGQIYFG